jgi:hypothetical protein
VQEVLRKEVKKAEQKAPNNKVKLDDSDLSARVRRSVRRRYQEQKAKLVNYSIGKERIEIAQGCIKEDSDMPIWTYGRVLQTAHKVAETKYNELRDLCIIASNTRQINEERKALRPNLGKGHHAIGATSDEGKFCRRKNRRNEYETCYVVGCYDLDVAWEVSPHPMACYCKQHYDADKSKLFTKNQVDKGGNTRRKSRQFERKYTATL